MSDSPDREEQLAELLAAAVAGRPERVLETALALEPADVRAAFRVVAETLASVGLALEPEAPSASLRNRVLASARARTQATSRAALVVVDMIREHLDRGGPLEVPRARAIVPALKARIERARKGGVPVVYVIDEHDPDDADLDALEGWGAHAIRGSEGTEVWPELAPAPGNVIVKKATYSAFTGSNARRSSTSGRNRFARPHRLLDGARPSRDGDRRARAGVRGRSAARRAGRGERGGREGRPRRARDDAAVRQGAPRAPRGPG